MPEGMDAAAVLRDRLAASVAEKGDALKGFVLLPGPVGGPHEIIVTIEAGEPPETTDEITAIEDEIAVGRAERRADEDIAALEDLARKLDEPPEHGIL